jgi:hypothetical protein
MTLVSREESIHEMILISLCPRVQVVSKKIFNTFLSRIYIYACVLLPLFKCHQTGAFNHFLD